MSAEAIATVSVAVVSLVQLVKWGGVPDRFGPLSVLICSVLGVAFWGWTVGDVSRATAFEYFSGWILVMTSAAGVHGFTRATGGAITKMRDKGDE